MTLALILPVFSAVTWYMLAAAEATRWLWSRYPPRLGDFALCPACAGTWYGAAWAAIFGLARGWTMFDLPLGWSIFSGAVWGQFFTPLLAWLLYRAMTTFRAQDDARDVQDVN